MIRRSCWLELLVVVCSTAMLVDGAAFMLVRQARSAHVPAFDSGTQYRWGKRDALLLKRSDVPAFDSGTQYRWGKRAGLDDIPAFDSGTQYRWGKRSGDFMLKREDFDGTGLIRNRWGK